MHDTRAWNRVFEREERVRKRVRALNCSVSDFIWRKRSLRPNFQMTPLLYLTSTSSAVPGSEFGLFYSSVLHNVRVLNRNFFNTLNHELELATPSKQQGQGSIRGKRRPLCSQTFGGGRVENTGEKIENRKWRRKREVILYSTMLLHDSRTLHRVTSHHIAWD